MIRIAICDDSLEICQQTKQIIESSNQPVKIICDTFEDGDALIYSHSRQPFDVIFLDVVMPLVNGIDTAKEIRLKDKNVKIVFLTSSREFTIDSYQVKASNYL